MKRQFTVLFGFTIALFVTLPVLPPPPSTAQGAPLVLWHHYPDGRGDLLASLADEYTTETSVEIAVQHYPDYPRQHNAILSALVNGGLPNLALVRSHDAALYALGNRVLDLNLLLDERIDSAAFYPAMWMQDELNGQRLGLPLGRSFEALYINQDALAELGFDAPPANLDEFSDMACAFAEAEGWSRYEGVNLVGYELSLDASLLIAMAQPVTFYDATDGFTFDDLGWTDLITRLQSLLTNGCIRLTLNEETGRQSRFAAGQALFYTASSSALPYLDQAIRDFFAVPFTLKVHPIPAHNGPVVNLYGPSLTIFDLEDRKSVV
jgi:ABC-type glycerol-3-phosphate transport system substrate-binding protein